MASGYYIGRVRFKALWSLSLVLRKVSERRDPLILPVYWAACENSGSEGHLPPLQKDFPTSFRACMRARQGFCLHVYEFSYLCAAFYLKATCHIAIISWDHHSLVYDVLKIIVYSLILHEDNESTENKCKCY